LVLARLAGPGLLLEAIKGLEAETAVAGPRGRDWRWDAIVAHGGIGRTKSWETGLY
jgi:hypothetical protein